MDIRIKDKVGLIRPLEFGTGFKNTLHKRYR